MNEVTPGRGFDVPINESQRLLIVRPHDLVVLAVRCKGFELDADQLVAGAGGGFVELTLPPQATGELPFDFSSGAAAPARLAGTSRLTLALPEGARLPLTADGFLARLASALLVAADTPFGEPPLAVELPWRLVLAPRPVTGGDVLRMGLPAEAQAGPSGAVGLWHLRVEAASGLALLPIGVGDDDGIAPPLNKDRREQIRAEATSNGPSPTAPYVDLSPLGGTVTAAGTWPSFSWRQETVLGRDMAVRTEQKGFLYPFGHRAVLISDTQRVLQRAAPAPEGTVTAGLRTQLTLLVTEPLRGPAEDAAIARGFPFDEVEILGRTFELDGEEVPERFPRVAKQLDALRAQLEADRQSLTALNEAIPGVIAQRRADLVANAEADIASARAEVEGIRPELEALEAADAAARAFVPPPPPPPRLPVIVDEFGRPSGGTEEEGTTTEDLGPAPLTQAEFDRMRELQGLVNGVEARVAGIQAALEQALAGVVDENGVADTETVIEARRLRESIPPLEARVREVADAVEPHLVVFEWPHAGGQRLRVPVRFGDVRTAMPMLFVHDQDLRETDDFERFAPLLTEAVQQRIRDQWTTANDERHVPLPGVPIDLVRAGPSQPADVLPVHELTIAGTQHGEGFRPQLQQLRVELAAARALVPSVDGLTRLEFDSEYLTTGAAEHVALRMPDGLDVDFRTAADRSGGLISPVFRADVLSRLDGPVDARALPGLPPDLVSVFGGATLLGIPLASVLDGAALPKPLAIVAEPGGGARMTWKDLPLRSHGPFQIDSRGGTRFELTVVQSPDESVTTCRIERFSLVLPPGGGDLVQLHFRALTFTQRPGRPPDLDVDGMTVELGGDLGLLRTLQKNVDLGAAAPDIRSTPRGMSASYALDIPEVTAGMFVMKNIAVSVGVDVPFDGRPVVASLGFATREDPFNLSVSAFGGGGYLSFEIAQEGIRKLEASLDFGATVAIGVGIATAEVHALGGVRFLLEGDRVRVSGFLRIGGSVDVLGLVSVSVELRVELSYEEGLLSGRATAVIEVDVTFWSGSIELDSGEYVFAGAAADDRSRREATATITAPPPSLPDWQRYRDAFAPVPA